MKTALKILFYFVLCLVLGVVGVFAYLYVSSSMASSSAINQLGPEAPTLQLDGRTFRDLNKNGKLDVYEDVRQPVESRVTDLLAQLNLEEKAGLMFITMAAMSDDGSLSNSKSVANPFSLVLETNADMVVNKKMNHFNTIQSHSPEKTIEWHNNIQKLAERTRLGIPITVATDPRHGVPDAIGASIYTPYFSKWCSYPGFAAIGDTVLMREFANIARQEYLAVGFRLTLSPMADLATEPRWARMSGTFGEDAEMAAKLTKAYILGFQGDSINNQSVECMVKHFAGGGPQENGMDAHFPPGRQAYKGNNFAYHLIPFEKGAFAAHVAQVMPYYGIPMGQTKEDVGFGYNKDIITGMLREKYKFDGVVCTDWGLITDVKLMGVMLKPASAHGVEQLTQHERVMKILDAGCDMFGGESIPETVIALAKGGKLSMARIDISVRRILREKFKLGLFDNPYVTTESRSVLGNPENSEKGRESQRRSLVLLKNQGNVLPLANTTKIFLQGFGKEAATYPNVVADVKDADVIVLKVKTPFDPKVPRYVAENFFHQGKLDFPEEEKQKLLTTIRSKPTITVISLERAAVFPEINEASKAVIGDFSSEDTIILDLIIGKFSPTGKLPFELPSSMEAVEKQQEDMPHDSENPLYPYGFGLSYPGSIKPSDM